MIIISHRGYWTKNSDKNSEESFKRSFQLGLGVETDIRDYKGDLVISHNIPGEGCMMLNSFFCLYLKYGKNLPLALNIKSDGLCLKLKFLINKYSIKNYFVFDMSVPDGLSYIDNSINYFTRQSEYEKIPSLYDESKGVWIDEFKEHWITKENIQSHIQSKKCICIVSPELHGRYYKSEWTHYKKIEKKLNIDNLMICTDLPVEAMEFFNE
jgi:hypothetical protein